MFSKINIPATAGATIFANDLGSITIEQNNAFDLRNLIVLTVEEARQVADALREIADYLDSESAGGAS